MLPVFNTPSAIACEKTKADPRRNQLEPHLASVPRGTYIARFQEAELRLLIMITEVARASECKLITIR